VGTEVAGVDVGKVIARRTTPDRTFHFNDGFRQLVCIGCFHIQDEESKPLRRLRANSRQFLKLFDQPADRFRNISH
jgi:hypothetical protein